MAGQALVMGYSKIDTSDNCCNLGIITSLHNLGMWKWCTEENVLHPESVSHVMCQVETWKNPHCIQAQDTAVLHCINSFHVFYYFSCSFKSLTDFAVKCTVTEKFMEVIKVLGNSGTVLYENALLARKEYSKQY